MNCIHGTTLSIRQSSGIQLYNIFVLVRKDLETHGTLFLQILKHIVYYCDYTVSTHNNILYVLENIRSNLLQVCDFQRVSWVKSVP